MVSALSHNHPHWTKTKPAAYYGLLAAKRSDGMETYIDLTPMRISIHNLAVISDLKDPKSLTGVQLNELLEDTGMFCLDLTFRGELMHRVPGIASKPGEGSQPGASDLVTASPKKTYAAVLKSRP